MTDGMNLTQWIRLAAIVGAYMLIRPYVLKFMSNEQTNQFKEQSEKDNVERAKAAKARISANNIRGEVEVPDSEDEDGEEVQVQVSGNEPQWGKKARKRGRKAMREIIEEQEKRLEEDDMEDIKDLLESDVLVDFEEGKDGW